MGECLFHEWFVVVLWVVFESEQSLRQASSAKQSLFLVRFWKKITAKDPASP
jgi:hypothetical protein